MTCEDKDLNSMSDEELFDAMLEHSERMFELAKDHDVPLELAEVEQLRIGQIGDVLNKRLPEPQRSAFFDLRRSIREQREKESGL